MVMYLSVVKLLLCYYCCLIFTGGLFAAKTTAENTAIDYAKAFYNLSLSLSADARNNNNNNNKYSNGSLAFNTQLLPKVHLVRIPKASSSSLSVVARRIVGCNPPGPCCRYPGDPKGSCPDKRLFKCQELGKVVGCTHHYPNIDTLYNPFVKSISIMREPISRAISAFFYPGIHHNSKCTQSQQVCFLQYTKSDAFRNIAVKMFTGEYSYADKHTCNATSTCRNSLQAAVKNLNKFAFVGVAEMWELSLLLLLQKLQSLPPVLSEFQLATPKSSSAMSTTSSGTRKNDKAAYSEFKKTARTKYFAELRLQNQFDETLYRRVVHNFCVELHRVRLWDLELVRQYWSLKAPVKTHLCS